MVSGSTTAQSKGGHHQTGGGRARASFLSGLCASANYIVVNWRTCQQIVFVDRKNPRRSPAACRHGSSKPIAAAGILSEPAADHKGAPPQTLLCCPVKRKRRS